MISAGVLRNRLAGAPVALLDRLGLVPPPAARVNYVVERANWSIHWDGTYICAMIDKIAPGFARTTTRPAILARTVVHFGSHFQWLAWADAMAASNKFVTTYFHGKPEDGADMARSVEAFLDSVPRLARIVTAAGVVENRLLSWGVPRDKLVRIPIGVDLARFKPASESQRNQARARYGIRSDHLCIGSFQKDGVGWGSGDEPKLIKGPDVLLAVIEKVANIRPVFVLLTGPARGYVKRGLERLRVPYAHEHLDDYMSIAGMYPALDVYLNPSREEGGPKGILEAMASGVPVVSTRVGMAPDLIVHEVNGMLAEPDDAAALAAGIISLAEASAASRERVRNEALRAVQGCDWTAVARRHLEEVYRPLVA